MLRGWMIARILIPLTLSICSFPFSARAVSTPPQQPLMTIVELDCASLLQSALYSSSMVSSHEEALALAHSGLDFIHSIQSQPNFDEHFRLLSHPHQELAIEDELFRSGHPGHAAEFLNWDLGLSDKVPMIDPQFWSYVIEPLNLSDRDEIRLGLYFQPEAYLLNALPAQILLNLSIEHRSSTGVRRIQFLVEDELESLIRRAQSEFDLPLSLHCATHHHFQAPLRTDVRFCAITLEDPNNDDPEESLRVLKLIADHIHRREVNVGPLGGSSLFSE